MIYILLFVAVSVVINIGCHFLYDYIRGIFEHRKLLRHIKMLQNPNTWLTEEEMNKYTV